MKHRRYHIFEIGENCILAHKSTSVLQKQAIYSYLRKCISDMPSFDAADSEQGPSRRMGCTRFVDFHEEAQILTSASSWKYMQFMQSGTLNEVDVFDVW